MPKRLLMGAFLSFMACAAFPAAAAALEITLNLLDARPGSWIRVDSLNRTEYNVVVSNIGRGRDARVSVQYVSRIHEPHSEINLLFVYGGAYIEDNSIDEAAGEETITHDGIDYPCRMTSYTDPESGITTTFWISGRVPLSGVVKARQEGPDGVLSYFAFSAYGFTRPQGLPSPEAAEVTEILELPAELSAGEEGIP